VHAGGGDGGAGFLGSHLCDRLLAEGGTCWRWTFITGAKENLSHLAKNKKFKFQKADVSKPLKVAEKWATCCTLLRRRARRLLEASHCDDDGGLRGHAERFGLALRKNAKFFWRPRRMLW